MSNVKYINDLELKMDKDDPNWRNQSAHDTNELVIEQLDYKDMKRIDWLWKNKLALGKYTLLAGEPGTGKSTLLFYIASIVSNGGIFQGETEECREGKVLLISGEDDSDDTILPRLKANEAKIENVHILRGKRQRDKNNNQYYLSMSLKDDIDDLEQRIAIQKYKLIIIDPIVMYMGNARQNDNSEVRELLAKLNAIAERHNLSVIINTHFNKPSGNVTIDAIHRIIGSMGFGAAARLVYGVIKDPDDQELRILAMIKTNISKMTDGLVYKIEQCEVDYTGGKIETNKIIWSNKVETRSANELLGSVKKQFSKPVERAIKFLLEKLKHGGVRLSTLKKEGAIMGVYNNELYDAKDELKIHDEVSSVDRRDRIWMLSPDSPDPDTYH